MIARKEASRAVGRPKKGPVAPNAGEAPRKLGRKSHSTEANNRDLIIDSAEQLFADHGYLGTSLQEVARLSNVTQALITYYFGTKQNLYAEVYHRRAETLRQRRMELLDRLRASKRRPSLREIVHAYVQPQFEMRRASKGGMNFARLQARLASEPQDITGPLRQKVYDQTLRAFMKEMERAVGESAASEIGWATNFLIALILYMLRDIDRLGEISQGQFHARDDDETVLKIVDFVVGGITSGLMAKR